MILIHQVPQSPLTGVRGWLSAAEDECLKLLAERFNNEGAIVVNSGVEYGRSISILAKFAPLAAVYGIELSPKAEYYIMMKGAQLDPLIMIADTLEVAAKWQFPIDLMFVDDNHELHHLRKEIPAWSKHIKIGGVIAFHDTAAPTNKNQHWLHAEVQQAIEESELMDKGHWAELDSADSIRVFERIV